jgi:fatty-acyl-CoA synthase
MTETSPLGSVAHPPAGVPEAESWRYRDTAGRLLCQVEARLIGDSGKPLPHDGEVVGEVEVRGPWITGAYFRDDDPAKFRDGWLRTGDVGSIDPLGFVTLTDRAKDVIKSGGEWISSMELENALMAHPEVTEAAVIGVPDARWPRWCSLTGRAPARRTCASSCRTGCRAGSCPSAGASSARCPRPASGSSPRPGSGRRTRAATTLWSRPAEEPGPLQAAALPPSRRYR